MYLAHPAWDEAMGAVAWSFVGLARAFGVAVLMLDIAGLGASFRSLFLGGSACLLIAAAAFFIDDYRRKKRGRASLTGWLRRRRLIVGLICLALVVGFVAYLIWDLGQPSNVIGL